MKSSDSRGAWAIVVAIALLPLLVNAVHHRELPKLYTGEAYVAYVCGGEAVLERRNPYLVEPIRSCEARFDVIPQGAVEPAPLPPVTLAFFALFAALPKLVAALAWSGILLGSYIAACLGLVRLAPRVPPIAIWSALAPSFLVLNPYFGETPPLVVAALVLAGVALRTQRFGWAAAAVSTAVLFEPHIGAAAWLAMLIFVPRTRLLLLGLGAGLAAGSVLAVGYATTLSYVTTVLPAHSLSELPANDQYSLTSMLYQVGWPARAALNAGIVSYAIMLLLGCGFAPVLARRLGAPELIVFLPAAAVLFGGTFIHDVQMSLALPLAVVVANEASPRFRPLAYATMLLGAIPEPWTGTTVLAFGAAAAFAVAWSARRVRAGRGALAAGAAALVAYGVLAEFIHKIGARPSQVPLAFPPSPADAIAEPGWTAYVTAVSHPATAGEFVAKLTVYALLAAALALIAFARRPEAELPAGSNAMRAGVRVAES
jgi:predicted membrane protein